MPSLRFSVSGRVVLSSHQPVPGCGQAEHCDDGEGRVGDREKHPDPTKEAGCRDVWRSVER